MSTKGIPTEVLDRSNDRALTRSRHVKKLIDWLSELGFTSKDVKLCIDNNGEVKCIAKKFISSDTNIFLSSASSRLTFSTLRHEVLTSRQNTSLNQFMMKIKKFEDSFQWDPNNYLRKDCFSNILPFVICIFTSLKKIQKILSTSSVDQLSLILKTFYLYWQALPTEIGNILYGWTEEENEYLKKTSLYKCLHDSKKFGIDIYEQLFHPFVLEHKDIFGDNTIPFTEFIHICSIVSSRTFGDNDNQEFIPIIDLVNGKPNQCHNCVLDRICLNGVITQTIRTILPIYAGDELFLEYAQCGNADYLIAYNHIPNDRDVILHNPYTEISFNMSDFFESMLQHIHPHSLKMREAKKSYISEITGVPRNLVVNIEDLKNKELSIPQSMRQVLIFLQSDEVALRKTVETQRLKYSVQSHVIFHSFYCLLESQFGRPDFQLFNLLLASNSNSSNSSSSNSNSSSSNNSSSSGNDSSNNLSNSSNIKNGYHNSNNNHNHSNDDDDDDDNVDFEIDTDNNYSSSTLSKSSSNSNSSHHSSNNNNNHGSSSSSSSTSSNKIKTGGNPSSSSSSSSGGGLKTSNNNTNNSTTTTTTTNSTTTNNSTTTILTDNMKSALYLQLSERMVIETFINLFIDLFDELQYPTAISILATHLIAEECNVLFNELEKPAQILRSQICMICGSMKDIVRCSRCHHAYYCGTHCQQTHWNNGHKKTCKKIIISSNNNSNDNNSSFHNSSNF